MVASRSNSWLCKALLVPLAVLVLCLPTATEARGAEDLAALATPDPPTRVNIILSGETCVDSVKVAWESPPKSYLVVKYIIECTSKDDRKVVLTEGRETSIIVNSLEFETQYTCSVVSQGKFGDSEAATSDPFIIPCLVGPQNVTAVFPTENCGDTVRVSWEAPDTDTTFNGYYVECVSDEVTYKRELANDIFAVEFGPLDLNDVEFTCSVYALYPSGRSQPGVSTFTTGECPGLPATVTTNFPSVECGAQVQITWTKPRTGGEVQNYLLECTSDYGNASVLVPANISTYELGPLNTSNVEYVCSVAGVNQFGTGPASTGEPFITKSCPGAPNVTAIFPTSNCGDTARISWIEPDPDAVVDRYIVDCLSEVDEFEIEVAGNINSYEFEPQGTNYICSVVARNIDGDSPAGVAFFTAGRCSGPPSNIQTNFPSVRCGAQVRITWAAPQSGGPVESYLLECASDSGVVSASVPSSITTYDLGPLKLDRVEYTCSVSAVNKYGKSTADTAQPFVTEACPGAPNVTALFPTGNCGDTASISWVEPNPNVVVIKYIVDCISETDEFEVEVGGDVNFYEFKPQGTEYICSVVAIDAEGSSPAGIATFVAGQCSGPPSNVQTNFPTVNCGAKVEISWTAPTTGGDVSNYVVECDSSTGVATKTVPATETSTILGPLNLTDVDYTCFVAAVNQFGVRSAFASTFTTRSCPGAPSVTALFPTVNCGNTARITWVEPDPTANVDNYIVDCLSSKDEFKETVGPSVTSFEFVPNLFVTPYTCSVVARNADGDSPAGVASFITGTCAGPPTINDIIGRTSTSLVISWEDNAQRGNPEEVYDIRCVTPGSPCLSEPARTGGPFQREYPFPNLGAISTLVQGVKYDCYIVAINPTGRVCSTDFLSGVEL